MSSLNNIPAYLKNRGFNGPWKISPEPKRKFDQTLVIPVYAESEYLPPTLLSLNENNADILKDTLVVVVINNAENSPEEIRGDNQHCLELLKSSDYQFSFCIVDAFSKGLALSQKHAGVGLARKIGMDLVLPHLATPQSLLFCIDADTLVSSQYIKKVKEYFDTNNALAAVVGFRHLESVDSNLEKAIGRYEKYLLTTAQNMRDAGSPYGYVAMGSTMVCTAKAYCAVGGMPRKKATEDFYFLQELTKYCGVETIPEILVFPSPRPISRVYLGTGFRMQQMQKGFDVQKLYYSDTAFSILEQWLKLGSTARKVELSIILQEAKNIDPKLEVFLQNEGIDNIWGKLQNNTPSKFHFNKQFHRWFDGLKTIRFLKRFTTH